MSTPTRSHSDTSQLHFSIRVYRIYDTPGYRWELNWTDEYGEDWSEEVATDEDLVNRITDLVSWHRERVP